MGIMLIKNNIGIKNRNYSLKEFSVYLKYILPNKIKRIERCLCGVAIYVRFNKEACYLVRANSSSKYSCERVQKYLIKSVNEIQDTQ